MTGRLLDGVGFDLNFVSAAQIDATIGICPAIEFDMQFEIFKIGIMDQFRTVSRTYQVSVFNLPNRRACSLHLPASQIFSVEQGNRLPPLRDTFSVRSRPSLPGPLPNASICPRLAPRHRLPS